MIIDGESSIHFNKQIMFLFLPFLILREILIYFQFHVYSTSLKNKKKKGSFADESERS